MLENTMVRKNSVPEVLEEFKAVFIQTPGIPNFSYFEVLTF